MASETDLIEEAIIEWWGERCDTYDADCPCCRAWEQLDNLQEADNGK